MRLEPGPFAAIGQQIGGNEMFRTMLDHSYGHLQHDEYARQARRNRMIREAQAEQSSDGLELAMFTAWANTLAGRFTR